MSAQRIQALGAVAADFLGGAFVGIMQCALLAAAGLYISESGPLWVLSFLRYGALFGACAGVLALLFQFVALLRGQPAGGLIGTPLVFAGYVALWGLFLGREGHRGSLIAYVGAGFLLLSAAGVAAQVLFSWFRLGARGRVPRTFQALGAVYVLASPWLILSSAPVTEVAPEPEPEARTLRRADLPRRNILLLSYDTLRADHLGCYGYGRPTSPAIDSLATSGTRYARAYCQRPKTSPSFATIHTGNYPVVHGIHAPKQLLQPDNLTLAETLSAAGYATGASVTNGNLYPEFGFDQGFVDYLYGHKDARTGARLAREWLDRHGEGDAPWFLWVHFTDPHAPYEPDPPFDAMFDTGATEEPARSTDLYDGEIRYSDAQSRWLLSWLHEHPEVQRNTLVVFTADHGESLGEHDYWFEHGLHPYEPSARIPLILSAPDFVPRGVEESLVGAVDLLPTLLDLVGLGPAEPVQGRSLAPLLLGESDAAPRDHVYLEAGYGPHIGPGRTRALVRDRFKYVDRLRRWAQWPSSAGEIVATVDAWIEGSLAADEFYDLSEDPAESENLLMTRPRLAAAERARLVAVARSLTRTGRASVELDAETLDPKTAESLRALGYIE